MDALNIIILFINICGYIFWLGLFANVIYWVLPNKFKSCTDEKEFKSLLCTWDGPSCSCLCCKLCKLNYM